MTDAETIKMQQEMIEGLISGQETLQKYIKIAKAEVVKEFEKRILDLFPSDKHYTTISRASIKMIAAEMVGADNG